MADELVSIRVRLSGGAETAREAKVIGTEIRGVGTAAEEASLTSGRAASGIHRALGKMGSAWSAVKRVGKLAAGGLIAGGAAALIYGEKASKSTQDLAKATSALHNNMGFAYQNASALLSVFKVRGVEPAKVGIAFKSFGNQLRSAATGSESAIGIFRKLGLSQDDIQKGLTHSEYALGKVARGFGQLPPSFAKSTLGAKLFGKSYEAIFPLLREGPGILNEQIAKAKEYGAVMNGEAITGTMGMVEAQRELQLAQIGWQITFATKVEPTLVRVVVAISKFINGMREGTGAGGKFAAIMRVVGQVLTFTYKYTKIGVEWAVQASKAIAAWSAAAAQAVAGGFRAFLDWITTTWRNVTNFISSLIPVKIALAAAAVQFSVASMVIRSFANFIGPILGLALHTAGFMIAQTWRAVKLMGTIISDVIGIVSNLLRGNWAAAWQSAKGLVGDVVNGIGELLGGMLDFLAGLPGRILGAMKGVGKAIAGPFIWAYEKVLWAKEQIESIGGILGGGTNPSAGPGPSEYRPGQESAPGVKPPGSSINKGGPKTPSGKNPFGEAGFGSPRYRLRGAHGGRGRSLPDARGRPTSGSAGPQRRGDRVKQPLIIQVGARPLAETVIDVTEDDEARE